MSHYALRIQVCRRDGIQPFNILFIFCLALSLFFSFYLLSPAAEAGTGDKPSQPGIASFYANNGFSPIWTTQNGPTARAVQLVSFFRKTYQDGLFPPEYYSPLIDRLWLLRTPESLARLDILLTQALARYLRDITTGRLGHQHSLQKIKIWPPEPADITPLLERAVKAKDLLQFLNNQQPRHTEYHLLKEALSHYRAIGKQLPWPTIPLGQLIEPGSHDRRIPLIVKRLQAEYTIPSCSQNTTRYTHELKNVIIDFQRRFQLEPDGRIGNSTISALNIPPEKLLEQLIINLERWRWLPQTFTGKTIMVNIAGFQLIALQNEQEKLKMPVVVGHVFSKTPVFSDTLRYLVINPYWTLPESIVEHIIPAEQQNDPHYLSKNKIKIYDGWKEPAREISPESIDWATIGKKIRRYRFRQEPGPQNALGQLKFMFPNQHDVYLHGTTEHSLFNRHLRAYSHGCIRLSDPQELAVFLLKDNKMTWDYNKISSEIASGKRQGVFLDRPADVYLSYRTVSVDSHTKKVFFYRDIYGRDSSLKKRFFRSRPVISP